ncbi:MAG TPA: hypothetical protein VGW57_02915 [Chthoniobacterales bacterium]|nr:hypothetical protein [Chthoniobacterales bacterium]
MGIVAVLAFGVFATRIGVRDDILACLALAMTPIFYVSSVTSKDYIWALGFIMLSLLAALDGAPLFAGIFLGLATGCRLTSLGMLVPVLLVLIGASGREGRLRKIVALTLSWAVMSTLFFVPVFARYGADFLSFYEKHARPDWGTVLERGTIEVWGTLGVLGLVIVGIGYGVKLASKKRLPASALSPARHFYVATAFAAAIVIYVTAYLRLPDQAGYLLPLTPAVLLLAALYVVCASNLFSDSVRLSDSGAFCRSFLQRYSGRGYFRRPS